MGSRSCDDDILSVLGELRDKFPPGVADIIYELVEHNEPGVALDTLCSQTFEAGISLSEENRSKLLGVAASLGIPTSQLDGLSA